MKTTLKISEIKRSAQPSRNQKHASALAVIAVCFLMHGAPNAAAQAPSSIAGRTFSGLVTDATTPPWAPPGSRWLWMADSSGNYQVRGIWHVSNDGGTYSYSADGAIATTYCIDNALGSMLATYTFATPSSGTCSVSNSPYYMNSAFELFSGSAPSSLAGNTYYLQIEDGASPLSSTGWLLLKTAQGGSYQIIGDGAHTSSSSGTYSYSTLNTATGSLLLYDSVMGNRTAYLSFSNSTIGGFAVAQSSAGGFQFGHFINLQTAVQIISPATGSNYTTGSDTLSLTGTASDNLGISQVVWTNNLGGAGTATGTTNWTADAITLQPGLNLLTVTALDTVGNTAQATLAVTYAPTLNVAHEGNNIILSWSTNFTGFTLQYNVRAEAGGWLTLNLPLPPVVVDGRFTVSIPKNFDSQNLFYHLSNQ